MTPDDDRARGGEHRDDRRVRCGDAIEVGGASTGGRKAGDVEEVLDDNRHFVEQAPPLVVSSIEGVGLDPRLVGPQRREGVQGRLGLFDGGESCFDALPARPIVGRCEVHRAASRMLR